MQPTYNLNIRSTVRLSSPKSLQDELPMTEAANETVVRSREALKRILDSTDSRLLVAVGPCSIHDPAAALEYARRLRDLAARVEQELLLVMRVYFEKPRTTVGWKGLINDPHLNDTFDMETGLRQARGLLLAINELGVPTATEILEPITPQYIADLLSLASIGARTTESPIHRQLASGLSMPVGFKNGTDGSLQVALDAMVTARQAHSFLGIDVDGYTSIIHAQGNPWGLLVLRGGRSGHNYTADRLSETVSRLAAAGLPPRMMVDCSHANSDKDYRKQAQVWHAVLKQRVGGNRHIVGLMLESNLEAGNQPLSKDLGQLRFGVSITDGCIDWEETETLILDACERLQRARAEVVA